MLPSVWPSPPMYSTLRLQQIVIVLEQRLVGRAQEIIRRVVDVEPYALLRMRGSVKLVGNRLVNLRGIHEVLVVLRRYRDVQSVVGALVSVVVVDIFAQDVAGVIGRARYRYSTSTPSRAFAQHTQGQVSLDVGMLADRSAVAFPR